LNFKNVEKNLNFAIKKLIANDSFLLKHDVSERAITYKLALYLTPLFPGYDVDCEYNRNIEVDSGKKYIRILKDIADGYGLLHKDEKDEEFVYRDVYPDIIIHKRGHNKDNLLIIEMKKSSSNISCEYDIEKLKRYTSPEDENVLNYSFGAFVYIGVKNEMREYRIIWYREGREAN
jgi:hypothetical protein